MKRNSLEYRKVLNLTIKYNFNHKGFLSLKSNPNIEYFNLSNFILREERLIEPEWVIGLVMLTAQDCKFFRNYDKKYDNGVTERKIEVLIRFSILVSVIFSLVRRVVAYV